MRRILFLDDAPDRHQKIAAMIPNATHVETASDAIDQLRTNRFDIVMLDHDLDQYGAIDPGTGEDVAHWIIDHAARFKAWKTVFIVHSHNWIFGPLITRKLLDAGLFTVRYRAAETDPFFLSKVRSADALAIAAAVSDPDNIKIPTRLT